MLVRCGEWVSKHPERCHAGNYQQNCALQCCELEPRGTVTERVISIIIIARRRRRPRGPTHPKGNFFFSVSVHRRDLPDGLPLAIPRKIRRPWPSASSETTTRRSDRPCQHHADTAPRVRNFFWQKCRSTPTAIADGLPPYPPTVSSIPFRCHPSACGARHAPPKKNSGSASEGGLDRGARPRHAAHGGRAGRPTRGAGQMPAAKRSQPAFFRRHLGGYFFSVDISEDAFSVDISEDADGEGRAGRGAGARTISTVSPFVVPARGSTR